MSSFLFPSAVSMVTYLIKTEREKEKEPSEREGKRFNKERERKRI
jgi:hypothetical protein